MKLARPFACCVLIAAPLLASGGPAYADPTTVAGPHSLAGLPIEVPGHGKMGTYTYEVDDLTDSPPIAYCIDINTKYQQGAELDELTWSEAPGVADVGPQLNWVLRNSYPHQTLPDTAVSSGVQFHDGLSTKEAIAATQAALWHYSDGVDITGVYGTVEERADVLALYDYLTGPANEGIGEDPPGTLALAPVPGDKVPGLEGPVQVSTNAGQVLLTVDGPAGSLLVNVAGKAVVGAYDGDLVYLDVPDDEPTGSAMIFAKAASKVTTGRIFAPASASPESTTQTLVLATTAHEQLTAHAAVTWAAPATTTSPPPPAASTASPPPSASPSTSSAAPTTSSTTPSAPAPTSPPPATTSEAVPPPAPTSETVPVISESPSSPPTPVPAGTPTADVAMASPTLANTGASVGRTALLAGGLLAAGGLTAFAARRR